VGFNGSKVFCLHYVRHADHRRAAQRVALLASALSHGLLLLPSLCVLCAAMVCFRLGKLWGRVCLTRRGSPLLSAIRPLACESYCVCTRAASMCACRVMYVYVMYVYVCVWPLASESYCVCTRAASMCATHTHTHTHTHTSTLCACRVMCVVRACKDALCVRTVCSA